MTGEPKHTVLQETTWCQAYCCCLNTCSNCCQILKLQCGQYTSFLAMFNPLHIVTKNTTRRTSAINPVTMENSDDSVGKRKLSRGITTNQHLALSAKINTTRRWIHASPLCMYCTYCGMPKGTCWTDVKKSSP